MENQTSKLGEGEGGGVEMVADARGSGQVTVRLNNKMGGGASKVAQKWSQFGNLKSKQGGGRGEVGRVRRRRRGGGVEMRRRQRRGSGQVSSSK